MIQSSAGGMKNRFRSGHGCSANYMHGWNFQCSPFCDCGDGTVVNECSLRLFAGGLQTLHLVTPATINRLQDLDVNF